MIRAWLPLPLLLFLLLSACSRLPQQPPGQRLTAPELLQHLQQLGNRHHSLRGSAGLETRIDGSEQRSSQWLQLQWPDQFRADILSPFGTPLVSLASDGETFRGAWAAKGKYVRGPATAATLSRLLSVPMRVEDLIGLLLLRPPLLSGSEAATILDAAGRQQLLLTRPGAEQRVRFDALLNPVLIEYRRGGELWLRVRYGDFETDGDGFPRSIALELPGFERSLAFRLRELELNPDLNPAGFRLNFPAGARVESLF